MGRNSPRASLPLRMRRMCDRRKEGVICRLEMCHRLSPENQKLPAEDLTVRVLRQTLPVCLPANGEGIFQQGGICTWIPGAACGRAAVEGDMSASIPGENGRENATASSVLSGASYRMASSSPTRCQSPTIPSNPALDFPKGCSREPLSCDACLRETWEVWHALPSGGTTVLISVSDSGNLYRSTV